MHLYINSKALEVEKIAIFIYLTAPTIYEWYEIKFENVKQNGEMIIFVCVGAVTDKWVRSFVENFSYTQTMNKLLGFTISL